MFLSSAAFPHAHTSLSSCSEHLALCWNSLWRTLAKDETRAAATALHGSARSVFHLQNHLVKGKIQEPLVEKKKKKKIFVISLLPVLGLLHLEQFEEFCGENSYSFSSRNTQTDAVTYKQLTRTEHM